MCFHPGHTASGFACLLLACASCCILAVRTAHFGCGCKRGEGTGGGGDAPVATKRRATLLPYLFVPCASLANVLLLLLSAMLRARGHKATPNPQLYPLLLIPLAFAALALKGGAPRAVSVPAAASNCG